MRVLIVKTSALGDIIHALPLLDYLRQACPGIEVDWIVEEPFRDILEGSPLLSKLHVIRTRKWRKNLFSPETYREISLVRKSLRERQYDLVLDVQGNFKSGVITLLTGSRRRFGFSADFLQEKINSLFTNCKVSPLEQDDHAAPRYLRVASEALGKECLGMGLTTDIFTSEADNSEAREVVSNPDAAPVFLFHGGTTWQTKFWSEEGWVALGQYILQDFADSKILLSWGNEAERISAENVAKGIGSRATVLRKYSLKGITAIIKQVDLVIGGDTGLVHLAAAVGTPTVSYYRASNGSVSGPCGDRHVIVQSTMPCTRCFRTTCDRDHECRASIKPEMILAGVKSLHSYFKRARLCNADAKGACR